MLRAQQERKYDDCERMALNAVWRESAHRAKRIKPTDLFKRPTDKAVDKTKMQSLKEKTREANEWLAGLTGERRKE